MLGNMCNNIHSSPWIAKNLETNEMFIGMQMTNIKMWYIQPVEYYIAAKKNQNELQLYKNSLAHS